jgi:DNA helicase-2/ATP-dependent DNA helicase PcrA
MDSCNPPSRFVNEINCDYLDCDNVVVEEVKAHPKYEIDNDVTYRIGDHVIHDTYGEGIVVGIDDRFITIAFAHPDGIKKLIKGHGSYRKV